MNYTRSILLGATLGLVLACVFALGFWVRGLPNFVTALNLNTDVNQSGYPLLDEVQQLLDQVYLRQQPDYIQRQYAAVRGLLSALADRNTFFIEPAVARSEAQVLAGTYGGIGVQIKRNAEGLFELYPFVDSPASRAGIRDADILLAVNQQAIDASFQMDVVDQLLRGEVKDGNGINIRYRSKIEATEAEAFVEFAVINVPSVVWRVLETDANRLPAPRFGYIQLMRFTNRTPQEVREAIQDLFNQQVEGLVLDLRDNSGGLLEESIQVASEFVDGGIIVYEKNRQGDKSYEGTSNGLATQIPLVVLVNQRTASASELVAGAIRDRGRGLLIGQTSFGKGTVQQIYSLSDGSSVHITAAEWFTPSQTPIDGVGLKPDVEVTPSADGQDLELSEAIQQLLRKVS